MKLLDIFDRLLMTFPHKIPPKVFSIETKKGLQSWTKGCKQIQKVEN